MRIVAKLKKVLQYAALAAAAGIAGFVAAKLISNAREDDLEGFLPNHMENDSILWQPPGAGNLPFVETPPTPKHMPFQEEVEVEEIDIEE